MQSDPQQSPGRPALPRRVLDAGAGVLARFQLNLPGQLLALIIGLGVLQWLGRRLVFWL